MNSSTASKHLSLRSRYANVRWAHHLAAEHSLAAAETQEIGVDCLLHLKILGLEVRERALVLLGRQSGFEAQQLGTRLQDTDLIEQQFTLFLVMR
jgi:hypothetical protein